MTEVVLVELERVGRPPIEHLQPLTAAAIGVRTFPANRCLCGVEQSVPPGDRKPRRRQRGEDQAEACDACVAAHQELQTAELRASELFWGEWAGSTWLLSRHPKQQRALDKLVELRKMAPFLKPPPTLILRPRKALKKQIDILVSWKVLRTSKFNGGMRIVALPPAEAEVPLHDPRTEPFPGDLILRPDGLSRRVIEREKSRVTFDAEIGEVTGLRAWRKWAEGARIVRRGELAPPEDT